MRRLTDSERDALIELWFKTLDRKDAIPYDFIAGFQAGFRSQGKRIEVLEAQLAEMNARLRGVNDSLDVMLMEAK